MEMKNKITPLLLGMWAQASDERKYREAFMFAITGYLNLAGTEEGDAFLGPIVNSGRKILEPYVEEAKKAMAEHGMGEKRACSFCGKGEPEVKLGAGPSVYICDSCVSIFSEIFKDNK